jgi:hypothetical protein
VTGDLEVLLVTLLPAIGSKLQGHHDPSQPDSRHWSNEPVAGGCT